MSVVNCIVFGKTNIRFQDINMLLGLVRMTIIPRYNSDIIYIDNFILHNYNELDFITDSTEINRMKYYDDLTHKIIIAKNILYAMNNFPETLINHHNYKKLVEFIEKNEQLAYPYNNLKYLENREKEKYDY